MIRPVSVFLMSGLFLFLTSCAGGGHPAILPRVTPAKSNAMAASARGPHQLMTDLFAAAQGMHLTDADLDKYIDTPLSAADRALAHKYMAFMPKNQRGDFIAVTKDGRLISNNSRLLQSATLTFHSLMQRSTANIRAFRTPVVRHPMDYVSSCSPPNPPPSAGGPYVRQVSQCGFAAGWAFLMVPCGTTGLQAGESGDVYFELTGPNGSEVEGGLFTEDGSTFDPYLRSSALGGNGYETLTGSTYRYSCDEQMMIVHGVTQDQADTFTAIGDASAYDPESTWVNETQVTLSDPAWLFGPAPADVQAQIVGTDNAGYPAPCPECSMSEVTTIAQSTNTYISDGSYFGVNTSTGENEIEWIQVAFGNWDSDCEPNTSLCTFDVSSDPLAYYGGPQYYPDDNISQSNFGLTSYGAYETTNGIWLGDSAELSVRKAAIALNEPLPPPPCTMDSYGKCALNTSNNTLVACTQTYWNTVLKQYMQRTLHLPSKYVYATYQSDRLLGVDTETIVRDSSTCHTTSTYWSPGEPRTLYSDPNLP